MFSIVKEKETTLYEKENDDSEKIQSISESGISKNLISMKILKNN